MKKFATFALYASSIAVAVGIGMFQVGNGEAVDYSLGSAGKCTQKVTFPDCGVAKCGDYPKASQDNKGDVKDCVANFVPDGFCKDSDDSDCSDNKPTLSCNTDCE